MMDPISWFPERPDIPQTTAQILAEDFARFVDEPLPHPIESYLLECYGVDVTGEYAGRPVRCPFGKASGQLSMRAHQVQEDVAAGLGFVVLKTVIAEDAEGGRSMGAWATTEAKMSPEPITGRSGRRGWTVTWTGRGWGDSLAAYRDFVRDAVAIGLRGGVPVVPSVKYHLPIGEEAWRVEEYAHTTRVILDACEAAGASAAPVALEKDFSPTLAGSDRSAQRRTILRWLESVPRLIREAAAPRPVTLGLKLFNALQDDDFQIEMIETILERPSAERPDFLIYANRLFDPARGVAFGGPDLSDRNLRALAALRERRPDDPIPLSATGDVSSGRIALLHALLGCRNFQIHTGFQLPAHAYVRRVGPKVERALHALYFDPEEGLVAWLLHAAARLGTGPSLMQVCGAAAPWQPSALHAVLA